MEREPQDAGKGPSPRLFPATKFLAPAARPEHICRDRCLELATGPLSTPHLVISASAGAGKSTLAAQWAAAVGRTAWVSLATEDDDPGQLWAAVITGLQTVVPGAGAHALPALLGGTPTQRALAELIDDLCAHDQAVSLVLDDLHLIQREDCLDDVAWLLTRMPPTVRVCLCTRAEPPAGIPRLVARGLVTDLRGEQLSFDGAETSEFLCEKLGIEIDADTARAVGERVDGWPAGIYLAALSLRAGNSVGQLLASLETGDRRIRDYMHAELLSRLDADRLELLETLALLPRFCAGLCDVVLGRTGSEALLAELDASNLFVIRLDPEGRWLRLHHLFAQVLCERITERDPARVSTVHASAGGWHRDRGERGEAIHHFVAGGRYDEAASEIEAGTAAQINVSRLGATVAQWLDLLPAELVAARPALCLGRAWVAAIHSRKADSERWVQAALELDPDDAIAAEAALLQATFPAKDYAAGARHAAEAVRREPPHSGWQPLTHLMAGWYHYHASEPDLDAALACYARSEELATLEVHVASAVIAPAAAALVHLERGDRATAEACIGRTAERRRMAGVEDVPQMLNSYFGTAHVLRVLGRLDEAARDAEHAATIVADYPPENDSLLIAVPVTIELGRIRHEQGDAEGARAALADARARLAGAADSGRILGWLEEAEALAGRSGGMVVGELSERELTVMRMLAGTATTREIAGELFVSQNTMKTHCKAIYRKLGVGSRSEAVARAKSLGLI